eukprot:TRINITY_DN3315_c0_g1_i1.p1 TRINITY_DN3315_c0_g1~~TRINITY_DN3315_c0_g1_i1.p1  ORF type:complete len:746 (+),score=158.60 TRINITY_DN3315_c0_g1_i1:85-2322(+)
MTSDADWPCKLPRGVAAAAGPGGEAGTPLEEPPVGEPARAHAHRLADRLLADTLLMIISEERAEPALRLDALGGLVKIVLGTTEHTKALVDAGALQTLVRSAQDADVAVRDQSVRVLTLIATKGVESRDACLRAGVMDLMLGLVRQPTGGANEDTQPIALTCAAAVAAMLDGEPAPEPQLFASAAPTLCELLRSSDDAAVHRYALGGLARAVDAGPAHVQCLLDAGAAQAAIPFMRGDGQGGVSAVRVVSSLAAAQGSVLWESNALPPLLRIIREEQQSALRDEALWTLLVICEEESHGEAVRDAGGLPVLMQAARESDAVCEISAYAIAGLAFGDVRIRDECLCAGAMSLMLELTRERKDKPERVAALRGCVMAVSCMLAGRPAPKVQVIDAAVPALCDVLRAADDSQVQDAALRGLAHAGNARNQCLSGKGVAQLAVPFIRAPGTGSGPSSPHASLAVCVVGTLCSAGVAGAAEVVEAGALPDLKAILDHASDEGLTCKVLCVVSNIVNHHHLPAALDAGLIRSCVRWVRLEAPEKVREEAAWLLVFTLRAATPEQLAAVAAQGGHIGCYAAVCTPELVNETVWLVRCFRRLLDAGQRTVYLRHAGAELTDASALLADCGICAESVVELVSTEDGFGAGAQGDGGSQLPVFVVAGEHRVPVDVPCDSTVRDLVGAAAAAFRSLGWRARRTPGDRNWMVQELLVERGSAADEMAAAVHSVQQSAAADAAAAAKDLQALADHFFV